MLWPGGPLAARSVVTNSLTLSFVTVGMPVELTELSEEVVWEVANWLPGVLEMAV